MEILEQGSLELIGKECFGSLAEVSLQQSFCNHGCLKAVVWLRPGTEWEENSKQWEDMSVALIPKGKEREPIFSGIITYSCFVHIGGRPAVRLEAYSYTILMDRVHRNRSFQQESSTYGALFRGVLAPYQAAYIWNSQGRDEPIGRFLMQYRESDWEFLRRLASFQGHPIIPEVRFPGAKMYVGLPSGRKIQLLEANEYSMKKNLEKTCKNLDNKTTGGFSEGLEVEVKDRYEDYRIGDVIEFLKAPLIVVKKYSHLLGGQWIHDYQLRPSINCKMERMDNLELAGAAIQGTVLGTSLTSSKLALDTDMEGIQVESWHVQPVYYTGGGKGYSGQPEKGDSQYLYFPTMREEDRYILGGADAGEERITSIVEKASSEETSEQAIGNNATGGGTVNIASGDQVPLASTPAVGKAGGSGKATPQALPKTKSWTTPGNQKLILSESGICLSNGRSVSVRVSGSGINVSSSSGSLTLDTGEICGGAKNIEMNAKEYVYMTCEDSGVLLLPDAIHMKAEEVYIQSPENGPHEVVREDSVEAILNIYEEVKKSIPPLYASDGSVIRRKGYDDILNSEELFDYFEKNVYGKGDYENSRQPILTLYDGWLTDTYGKTAAQKFSDHLTTLDGFQEMLDVAGIVFEPADALNAFIYVCRGRYKEAALSGICCIPLIGDVVGKGGKLAFGAGTDIALKMGKDGKKVVEGLELVYKTTSDGAVLLRKNIDNALDFLSSGMNRGDSYRLCFAGGGYFGDSGKITFRIVDDAGEVTSYTRYMASVGEGAEKGVKEVIEGTGAGVKSSLKTTEVTPPGSSHPVKVYTDGNAQINTGKIDTYMRGKVELDADAVKSRINELKNIKKTNPETFNKNMKSELKSCEDKLHNYQRSQEMSKTLNNAGILDNAENNQMIAEELLEAAKSAKTGNTEIISYIEGANGKIQVVSRWKILDDGTPYLATVILKPIK